MGAPVPVFVVVVVVVVVVAAWTRGAGPRVPPVFVFVSLTTRGV